MQPLLVNVPEILLMILLVVLFRLLGRNRSAAMRLWVATWCVIWVHFIVLASAALLSQPVLIILSRGTLYFSGTLFVVLLTAAVELRSRWLSALGLFAFPGLAHTLAIALRSQNRAFYCACMLVFFAGIAFIAYRASIVQPKSLRALQVAALEVPFVVWGCYGTWQGHFVSGMFAMLAALFCLCGMLFWYSYRRVTQGVVISCAGFVSWGLVFPVIAFVQWFCPALTFAPHTWNLPKIVVALGIIVALLEDESQLAKATANRLQAILEHAPFGIVTCNWENHFEETNAAFQRMTGYSGEELWQMDWKALTHPDDLARNEDLVKALKHGEQRSYDFEQRYLLKDGKTIWVRVVGSCPDADHKISIIEDITQRKEVVEQLRRSEIQLRRLIDSNIIGVLIRSGDGPFLDANNAFLKMTGYTRGDLTNLRWPDLTPPEYMAVSDGALAQLRRMGSFGPFEKEYFRKDGSRIPVLICGVSTIADEAIIFVFDLTERRQAQAELKRLARIVETTHEAVLSVSLDGRILSWNRGANDSSAIPPMRFWAKASRSLFPKTAKTNGKPKFAHRLKTVEAWKAMKLFASASWENEGPSP